MSKIDLKEPLMGRSASEIARIFNLPAEFISEVLLEHYEDVKTVGDLYQILTKEFRKELVEIAKLKNS